MLDNKAKVIDGKALSLKIKDELREQVAGTSGRLPCLAVIIVGDDPASHFYVRNKEEACTYVGIKSLKSVLSAEASYDEVIQTINDYNANSEVDGILLQLPLPEALKDKTQEIVDKIYPSKDVDGLTTTNLGKLFLGSPEAIKPCTPQGCMKMLTEYQIELSGKKALVLGRSSLVGKPISMLLNQANATVTMAHSRTKNLTEELKQADIVVAAIGKAHAISGTDLKKDAVVIDVGINAVDAKIYGKKMVGDVDYDSAINIAQFVTPVPGGVGPMTVTMLLSNTLELYKRRV
jgi:methylenetetrahydrofolate dehydrogenase (NADP+)/methenyltetrahydrofolate cyclohydrolase